MELKWNVFYHDVNNRGIVSFNIFNHYSFNEDVQKNLKKIKDKTEFAKKLRLDLLYYFWCKAEYEVIISGLFDKTDDGKKIDIYTQVMNNFDAFIDYIWNSKPHRKTRSKKESKVQDTNDSN